MIHGSESEPYFRVRLKPENMARRRVQFQLTVTAVCNCFVEAVSAPSLTNLCSKFTKSSSSSRTMDAKRMDLKCGSAGYTSRSSMVFCSMYDP